MHPGKRNSLDAPVRTLQKSTNSTRTLRAPCSTPELLADVFLAMTRGQNSLMIEPMLRRAPDIGADGRCANEPLTVRRASGRTGEHARTWPGIDKESKGRLHLAARWVRKPPEVAMVPVSLLIWLILEIGGYLYFVPYPSASTGRPPSSARWLALACGPASTITWVFGMALASPAPRLGFARTARLMF